MREVRCVCTRSTIFEERFDLAIRQRTLPHLHHADFAVGEVASEVRRGTSHFENVPLLIRLREFRLLRDRFAIQPQLCGAAADTQHGGVRLSVVHLWPRVHRAEPADVIHQPAAANEQRLRIRRPLARRRTHRKQRAFAIRLKLRHRREVRAEIEPRIRKILRACLGQCRNLFRPAHEFSSMPHSQHRRSFRRMLDRDVLRSLHIEDEFIAELHLRLAFEMQTVVQRPFGRIERQGFTRRGSAEAGEEDEGEHVVKRGELNQSKTRGCRAGICQSK
jgi:hypothetical protein